MKKNLFALMAALAVCASCAKEIQEVQELSSEQQVLMTKLVGGSQGEIVPGNILVKTTDGAASVTEIDGIKVTPAIPVEPKNIEVAKKYGLEWKNTNLGVLF